jgi:peptidyl-prolyl cis-trans isomerase B (cyclophilin B)
MPFAAEFRVAALALTIAGALAVAGCGARSGKEAGSCPVNGRSTKLAPLDPQRPHLVTLKTSEGSFTIRLDTKDSPCATASFAALARKGFFDGTIFHRIVPGFVIQGGDPTGTGTGGPGYTTVDAPPANASYVRGVVAMAKTGTEPAGTAGSQFFVVTGADAGLPPDYALLGRVTSGLPVVERIGRLGGADERPTKRVTIEHASVAG